MLQQLLQSRQCLRLCIIVNPLKKRQLSLPFLGFSLPYALAPIYRSGRRQAHKLRQFDYTKPCAIIASATFTKPAIFAPVHYCKSVKKKAAPSAFFRIFLNLMHSPLFIGAAVGRRISFADFIILNLALS